MPTIEKRKSRNGTVLYRAKVRLKGFRPVFANFPRKTDARRWAQQTEADMRAGRYIKTAEAKRHTLAETIDRYIREVLPGKPANARNQEKQLLRWKARIGKLTLAEVTPSVISAERDVLLTENTGTEEEPCKRAPATVVRHLAALSHVFTVALKDWEWIDDTPLRKVRKPKEPRGRVRSLAPEVLAALLAACRKSKNPLLYTVVVLAISTGMRQGEILSLTKGQIDLERGRIVLHKTKNGERRTVPLTGHAHELVAKLVEAREQDHALLFPGADSSKPMEFKKRAWATALKRAGLQDFRFHDLRHCAASYLLEEGASLGQLAEVLGHKTLQMVQRYAHLSEPQSARIVGAMNARLFGGA